jgi:signal peptidase I
MTEYSMNSKPNKWIAAALSFFLQPIGFLYVARPLLALAYFSLSLAVICAANLGYAPELVKHLVAIVLAISASIMAFRIAARADGTTSRPHYSRWYGLLGIAALFTLAAVGVRAFLYEPFRAVSGSMEPSIPGGSQLVAQKWGFGNYATYGLTIAQRPISSPLRRGDILVFEFPDNRELTFVKRLIGLPGDIVVYRDKKLTINGNAAEQREIGQSTSIHGGLLRVFQEREEKLGDTRYRVFVDEKLPTLVLTAVRNFPMKDKCTYLDSSVSCAIPEGHYFVLGDNRDNADDSRYWGFVPADAVVGKVEYISPPAK